MLPHFALNARIFFILMVMFAFATTECATQTDDYVIMLKTRNDKALHINAGGRVTAADISLAQFFTMNSIGDYINGIYRLTLFSKEVGLYLCFRRGKLVGSKNLTSDCHFTESLDRGYFLYSNAYNQSLRVGFTRRFKPIGPNHLQRPQSLRNACFLFVKIRAEHFDHAFFTTKASLAANEDETPKLTTTLRTPRKGHRRRRPGNGNKTNINTENKRENNMEHNKTGQQRKRNQQNRLRKPYDGAADGVKNNINTVNTEASLPKHRQRQRKQHAKTATSATQPQPQPKNLVRHHHNNSTLVARRRQHEREQKQRHLRKQLHRQQREQQPTPTSSSSTSTSTSRSVYSATATLAPSALNIVAMLAASRRKRGRRKSDESRSEEDGDDDAAADKRSDVQIADSVTVGGPALVGVGAEDEHRFYSAKILEHRHRYRHQQPPAQHLFQTQQSPATAVKSSHMNGDRQQLQNEYSNNNHKSNHKSNHKINLNAIPALPKNLYHSENDESNRLTDYSSSSKFSSRRQRRRRSLSSPAALSSSNFSAKPNLSPQLLLRSRRDAANAVDVDVRSFSYRNGLIKTHADRNEVGISIKNYFKYLISTPPPLLLNINRISIAPASTAQVDAAAVARFGLNSKNVHANDVDDVADDNDATSAVGRRKFFLVVKPLLIQPTNNHNKYEKTIVQYRYEVSFISDFQRNNA